MRLAAVRLVLLARLLALGCYLAHPADDQCTDKCAEDESDETGGEMSCGTRCRVDNCSGGCVMWEQALNSSCQEVCNATKRLLSRKELYCTIGCENAMSQYHQRLKVDIGVPPTPILVEDSLAATSLTLKWENLNLKQFDLKVQYFAQWKYEDVKGNWQYCSHQNWNGNNQIFVHNLQPYTKYRFRLAISLMAVQQDDDPVFSEPSYPILTFPSGSPTSPPTILMALAIDHSRIYVNWKAGTFSNGPLFSYVLRLKQEGHEAFQLKDIPISQDTFMFQKLEPNTNYSVTLTMRNADGEGPATSVFVKTLFEPEVSPSGKPNLLLSSDHSVLLRSADSLSSPTVLYRSASRIRDSAILASTSELFISDSIDRLWRVSYAESNVTSELLLEPNRTEFRPWALSLDWLNSKLYVAGVNDAVGYWEIAGWDLKNGGLRRLVTRLINQPMRLEVDPINGYLFWLSGDEIYRVDLGLIGRNAEVEPEQILKKPNIGAFMVDYMNRRLLVVYPLENTVKFVSLDGKVVIDIRINTKQPKFKNATSISMTNGLFYWTNGAEVLIESYESTEDRYFHNVLFDRIDENLVKVHILTEDSQPIPIPSQPPRGVECSVLSLVAQLRWSPPGQISGQSPTGAWSNWSYALKVEDELNNELIQEDGLTGNTHKLGNLKERSLYTVSLAAYSAAGMGPWSTEFKIRTLRRDLNASIIWMTEEQLLQSDLIGENVRTLVNVTELDDNDRFSPIDICWYKDSLFVVGNNSRIYVYNTTSQQKNVVEYVKAASSVAVEWISKKLYWADPKRQIIIRSNIDGSQQEPIAFAGIARKLLIDSLEANVYWSTSRTVEVTRLNGENKRRYRSEDDFNGLHVAGLTLDMENRFVYWVVGDYENDFKLYRSLTADMLPIDREIVPELVSTISNMRRNSLSYISERFILLSTPLSASTIDAYGKYSSNLPNITSSPILYLSTITPTPPQTPLLVVQPESVNASSIAFVGTWRDFNVTWQPINKTNYGRVFYQVSFADIINVDAQPIHTIRNSVSYANADRLLPYSLVEVTIRAYTYWDSSPSVSRVLRSPQSVPSQPVDPRLFVESYKDPMAEQVDYFITFRWNMPEFVNGPILGFIIQCWIVVDDVDIPFCESVNVPVNQLEYKIHNLQANTTYNFIVCAYAEVGSGPYIDPISVTTDVEYPVPQLLVATIEDVKKVDLDQRTNFTITRHIAVEVAYLASEAKIYWINEMQELVTADVDGRNITKILTLNNTALSLCADWISRNLFWTEANYEDSGISHIMKLDLTVWEAGILKYTRILSRNRRIVNLDIAPLAGTLFWMELSTSDLGYVMQSDLFGGNVQPFFNHTEDCSCPFRPTIQPVFTIDNADPQNPLIYWMSAENELYITDIEGCICNLVLDAARDRGLPPTSLTTDKSNIYWSDMTTGKIHYMDKTKLAEDLVIREYLIADVRNIRAIGKSLQPYPDSDCLIPQRAVYSVQQVSKTSTSITIKLPEPTVYLGCEKYNLPATLYTIDVSECKKIPGNHSLEDVCSGRESIKFQTYGKEFEVKDLIPFTEYRFKLTLGNYYGDQELANVDQHGPGRVLRTGAGVPSKPENVRVQALTPVLGTVEWKPPKIWNAEFLHYEVCWKSTRPINGVRPEGEKLIKDGDFNTTLQSLLPGNEYVVYVRAYPENSTDVFTESDESFLTMYSEPNNLTLFGGSSQALNVSWIPMNDILENYTLEFSTLDSHRWQVVDDHKQVDDRLIFRIDNLKAKEHYKFRLLLRYRGSTEDFVWPTDERFTFHTLEDIPTAPGTPVLVDLQDSNYQLRWEAATSLSSQSLMYFLEAAEIGSPANKNNAFNETNKWDRIYNGSENYWDIRPNMHEKYVFRVRAKNHYGFGNWSEISSIVDLTEMTRAMVIAQEHLGLILGLSIPAIMVVLLCFCYNLCPFHKKSKEDQKKVPIKMKPHVELATLREIPRGNFVESNALYVAAIESDSNDSLLPKIQRERISLAKFLGSGAFGEVFQGTVRDLEGPGSKTPVAVKTLRKGASAQEKSEFLQEAKLMSHFQHKHVLRLLGVCLDTDPPLLLLELMAGGDLLSYLRTSRSMKTTDSLALRLQDLLSMCEDVARGCQYLEELHFVHRDLACRNCLVSARERQHRLVKIGDFGLARDIYKNDYYRKEGEGLLPVRWMAPESLVDGVFTVQSDVWAFGVLMWEITSLGQQPYQARTNLEVLHHVRAGGRLPKPLNCPQRLHQLMLKCWSSPESRPSFKQCLEHIVALRTTTPDATLSPVNPGQFLLSGNAYKSNHLRDSLNSQPSSQDPDSPKSGMGPKYSWLLDDDLSPEELEDPRAAYEIPKSIPVVVGNTSQNESRYVEICTSEQNNERGTGDNYNESYNPSALSESRDNPRWNRISMTSLNLPDKKYDKLSPSDKRSSTASLDKSKSVDGMKQSGSYARLVGNGSVTSLSDWRRVKRIASDERERSNIERNSSEETKDKSPSGASSVISYSMVTFPHGSSVQNNEITKTALPKLQRSKSNLQTSKANIPLVINSGLLNMLRQESEIEDDVVTYENMNSETVTDL